MEIRHIAATVHGRYLVKLAESPAGRHWVVGFHGYGETAADHLKELLQIPAEGIHYASLQALHPFYTRSGRIAASWMTSLDREQAIADNIRYVDTVLAQLKKEHRPERITIIGYSQGAAMALRTAFLGAERTDSVIAIGGEMPPEFFSEASLRSIPTLICRGAEDPHYSVEQYQRDIKYLSKSGMAVVGFQYEGGHEWNEQLRIRLAQELSS